MTRHELLLGLFSPSQVAAMLVIKSALKNDPAALNTPRQKGCGPKAPLVPKLGGHHV